ncbi:hypothetical protein IKZ80_06375 [bacterium]|nr:hypothetical protein [bacterium]
MSRNSYAKAIKDRISKTTKPFILADFYDLANRVNVRKVITRLERSGFISRIARGIYFKTEYSKFLKEYIKPSPDAVAKTIARNFGWNIIPCGNTALNMLGLSTQVPAVYSYASNGNYKSFSLMNSKTKIHFKHIPNKEIVNLSEKTALLIQAIKAYGKSNIDQDFTDRLKITFSQKEIKKIKKEAQYTTSWIYEYILTL